MSLDSGRASANTDQFSLRWNDFERNFNSGINDLRESNELFDVDLVAEGIRVFAHKVVLSACSTTLRPMLVKSDNSRPLIYLVGVKINDLYALLNFMYRGEACVYKEDFSTFFMTARQLGIRGLTEHDDDSPPLKSRDPLPQAEPTRLSPMPRRERLERRSQDSPPPKHLKTTSSFQKSYPITAIEKSDSFGSVCKPDNVQQTKSSFSSSQSSIVVTPDLPSSGSAFGTSSSNDREALARTRNVSPGPSDFSEYMERSKKYGLPNDVESSEIYRAFIHANPNSDWSFHILGGRDLSDRLTNLQVMRTNEGWHCPDCHHVSTTKGNLKSHILSGKHKFQERPLGCDFCGKTYSTKQSLQVHISTNHRDERNLASIMAGFQPGITSALHEGMSSEYFLHGTDNQQQQQKYFTSQSRFEHPGNSFETDESRDGSTGGNDYPSSKFDSDFRNNK